MIDTSTLEAIKTIAPGAKVDVSSIASTLDANRDKYGINTNSRIRAFLAQAAHETAGFKTLEEYASGAGYEGRTDLGNTQPGDGRKFKGRGIFQITGRINYKDVSRHLFGDDRLLNSPHLLEEPVYATLSAMHFWKSHNLNALADRGDFEGITRKINGGLNGWADRLSYYEKMKLFVFNLPKGQMVAAVSGMLILGLMIYYVYRIAKDNK